jgi:glutamate 5-kinase
MWDRVGNMGQTVVVKIGTSSLTNGETGHLALATIAALVEVLSQLRQQGHQVVLVSSGAVGVGCARLKLSENDRTQAGSRCCGAGASDADLRRLF